MFVFIYLYVIYLYYIGYIYPICIIHVCVNYVYIIKYFVVVFSFYYSYIFIYDRRSWSITINVVIGNNDHDRAFYRGAMLMNENKANQW